MAEEPGVVDLDDSVEADQRELFFDVDREKAGRNGISTEDVAQTLRLALAGMPAGHRARARPSRTNCRSSCGCRATARSIRRAAADASSSRAAAAHVGAARGAGHVPRATSYDKTIYHKNQERVVYVTGRMAGRGPAYAVLALQSHFKEQPAARRASRIDWRGEGEWKITLDVFRDLGIAFSVALLGIYVLLVYETGSYLLPVDHHAVDSADHDRHHARLLAAEPDREPAGRRVRQPGVLHRHGHDRHDRAERHRGPQRASS